jgi:ferredoxin-NADP reductase
MRFVRRLDQILNGITMYRLVMYGLMVLALIAIAFGFMGALGFSPWAMLGSFVVLIGVCYGVNVLLAMLLDVAPSDESSVITACILFFILPPPLHWTELALIALAGFIAMASKYVLAFRRKHLFNPAAIAAVIMSLSGLYAAIWWVATPVLLPFTLALGLLVIRKIRRFRLVGAFALAALTVMLIGGLLRGRDSAALLVAAFTSWPLVFFGAIMLTEPSTTPPRTRDRVTYGLLTGALFSSQIHLGPLSSTPELVLVIGNLYSYLVSPRYGLRLRLTARHQLSPRVAEFIFEPDRPFQFQPGQYMDFTLGIPRTDLRGNRRTFSLASSPTEPEVRLGVKFYEPSSTFKAALRGLQPGAVVMAHTLAGDFTLPTDTAAKLTFVAGGIGITPFRSMLKYLVDTHARRDITLFYLVSDPGEISFRDVLDAAAGAGVTVVPVLDAKVIPADWAGATGPLTPELITRTVPDAASRLTYISGPSFMVDHYREAFRQLGVPAERILTDHFSGY